MSNGHCQVGQLSLRSFFKMFCFESIVALDSFFEFEKDFFFDCLIEDYQNSDCCYGQIYKLWVFGICWVDYLTRMSGLIRVATSSLICSRKFTSLRSKFKTGSKIFLLITGFPPSSSGRPVFFHNRAKRQPWWPSLLFVGFYTANLNM